MGTEDKTLNEIIDNIENRFNNVENRLKKRSEKVIGHTVAKSLLRQTGIFFISLAILIAIWSAGFGFVLSGQRSIEENIKAEIRTIRTEVINNKINMTKLESKINSK